MIQSSPPDDDFPWWLLIVGAALAWTFWQIRTQDYYSDVLDTLQRGIWITVIVTVISYTAACALGLLLALGSMSRWIVVRQLCRLYVEVMRGIPILVLLLYVAFIVAPALVDVYNWVAEPLGWDTVRGGGPFIWRAILALTLAYSSFLAEVFRAGLQSVDKGQIEAAQALGLGRWHRFRHIVFPQAIRTILPPLGNDFVAMIKDSSLVSVVGVADIAQLAKITAAGNFRYFETYNVAAVIYLTLTIGLSLGLRRLEKHLRRQHER